MSPDRVNNGLAPLRNERLLTNARRTFAVNERKTTGATYKLITITKRQAGNLHLHEARYGKRRRENEADREETRRAAGGIKI